MSTIYTSDNFAKFKEEVLSRKIARQRISLAGLEIISEDVAKYGGVHFHMTKPAFNSLLKILQISKGLRNSLIKTLGVNFVDKFIATITSRLDSNKAESVMVIDIKKKTILNFLSSADQMLSNESYFKEVEKVVDRYNLDITRLDHQDHGGFSVSTIAPNTEWGLQNLPDEVFKFGISFSNDAFRGTLMASYNERLVCENGMTSRQMMGSCKLMSDEASWKNFEYQQEKLFKNGFQPGEFGHKVKEAIQVQASISEVESARNLVLANTTMDEERLELYLPYMDTVSDYRHMELDVDKLNANQKKNAKSAITYWELINDVTYIASNVSGIGLKKPATLQMYAGDLLSRTPDCSNLVLSPYDE